MIRRVFTVLEAIAETPRTAAETGRLIGVDRSTALRLLRQLMETGYIHRDQASMRYSTDSGRFYVLAANGSGRAYSMEVIEPLLLRLRNEHKEAVVLAVPASGSMVYVEFLPSLFPVTVSEQVGSLRPMHTSALGKAYLAAISGSALDDQLASLHFTTTTENAARTAAELRTRLDETRQCGYAVDVEETIAGVNCVAVPVRLAPSLIGAIGLTGPSTRLLAQQLHRIGPELSKAVTNMGYAYALDLGDRTTDRAGLGVVQATDMPASRRHRRPADV